MFFYSFDVFSINVENNVINKNLRMRRCVQTFDWYCMSWEFSHYFLRYLWVIADWLTYTPAYCIDPEFNAQRDRSWSWLPSCTGAAPQCGGSDQLWGARGGPNTDECGGAAGENEEEPGGLVAPREEERDPVPLALLQQRQPCYYPAGDVTHCVPMTWTTLILETSFCANLFPAKHFQSIQ